MGQHNIPLNQAIQMVASYRSLKDDLLKGVLANQVNLPNAESFNRDIFDQILKQTGCTGIRVYYSFDPQLQLRLVIVGTDASGNDILPSDATAVNSNSGTVGEAGSICPPACAPSSPLNP
ncbi:MAG: hypothetical protein ACJ748_04750 [Flavisolibacter sp.]